MRLPNFSLIEAVHRLLDLIACKIQSLAEVCFEVRIMLRVLPFLKIESSSKDEDTHPALFSL